MTNAEVCSLYHAVGRRLCKDNDAPRGPVNMTGVPRAQQARVDSALAMIDAEIGLNTAQHIAVQRILVQALS